jgi:hypothetical protein
MSSDYGTIRLPASPILNEVWEMGDKTKSERSDLVYDATATTGDIGRWARDFYSNLVPTLQERFLEDAKFYARICKGQRQKQAQAMVDAIGE